MLDLIEFGQYFYVWCVCGTGMALIKNSTFIFSQIPMLDNLPQPAQTEDFDSDSETE